jgi:hypothetical protein
MDSDHGVDGTCGRRVIGTIICTFYLGLTATILPLTVASHCATTP